MVGENEAAPIDIRQHSFQIRGDARSRSAERGCAGRREPEDLRNLIVAVEQHRLDDVPHRAARHHAEQLRLAWQHYRPLGLGQAHAERGREIPEDQRRVVPGILDRHAGRGVEG